MATKFYAAHLEGEFDSVESALKRAGLDDDAVARHIASAAINQSEAVIARVDEETSALVTRHEGRSPLWRGFTGPSFLADTESEAEAVIREFQLKGIGGKWAIFEYTPPVSRTKQ